MNPEENYPSEKEIDLWCESIYSEGMDESCSAEVLHEQGFSHSLGIRHTHGMNYVKFSPEKEDSFYGYWQSPPSKPAPLLVHVPGYGSEFSLHPDLSMGGYNVLHINPLGHGTPEGPDESRKKNGNWPVLQDTVRTDARGGYFLWLKNCVQAVRWAMAHEYVLENRVSFFGSSQGGAGSLLLGSIYRDHGVRCVAADVPFLTNFSAAQELNAYPVQREMSNEIGDDERIWRALGYIDTRSHAHRLTCPVMLTAGGEDVTCPPPTVESLFELLPGTKQYMLISGRGHCYTPEFIPVARGWFRLYS